MRVGRVVGNLVSVIKEPTHIGKKMMLIRFLNDKGEETEEEYVYADASGAGVGDLVLVSEDGSAAETEFHLENDVCTFDGVIVGVVDRLYYDPTITP
jgi:ethanolamine utilization protein EutN